MSDNSPTLPPSPPSDSNPQSHDAAELATTTATAESSPVAPTAATDYWLNRVMLVGLVALLALVAIWRFGPAGRWLVAVPVGIYLLAWLLYMLSLPKQGRDPSVFNRTLGHFFAIVPSESLGLLRRKGQAHKTLLAGPTYLLIPGLHSVEPLDSTDDNFRISKQVAPTKDGVEWKIDIIVIPHLFDAVAFNNRGGIRNFAGFIEQVASVAQTVAVAVFGRFTDEQISKQREDVAAAMLKETNKRLKRYGYHAVSVGFADLDSPWFLEEARAADEVATLRLTAAGKEAQAHAIKMTGPGIGAAFGAMAARDALQEEGVNLSGSFVEDAALGLIYSSGGTSVMVPGRNGQPPNARQQAISPSDDETNEESG